MKIKVALLGAFYHLKNIVFKVKDGLIAITKHHAPTVTGRNLTQSGSSETKAVGRYVFPRGGVIEGKSLKETIITTGHQDTVDVIQLDTFRHVSLLQIKSLPQCAFAVWNDAIMDTASTIVFKGQNPKERPYFVTCLCSRCLYDIESFKESVVEACQKHKIKVVFVRHANFWEQADENLSIVEACCFRDTLKWLSKKSAEDVLDFLDPDRSEWIFQELPQGRR
ncbi:MAG: hypothetical protein PHT88_03140 [Candidatus Moranbacteria bacterium]|nr:hypothetical protein [Candidatus Moranbacteria bacterium]